MVSLPSSPKPTPGREENLSSYASHLQALSRQLDERASALKSSEAELAASQSALATHRHALTRHETRARHQATSLLAHLRQRQAALVEWENRAAVERPRLARSIAAVDALLVDAADARTAFDDLCRQRDALSAQISQRRKEIGALDARIDDARVGRERLEREAEELAQRKTALQRAVDRLQSLETAVRAREVAAETLERIVDQRRAWMERLKPFESISLPLQAFLDHAAAATLIDRISVKNDPSAAVDTAVFAMGSLQTTARNVSTEKEHLKATREQLGVREQRLKTMEADFRKKRQSLDREEANIKHRLSEVSTTQTEVGAAWQAIEEARKEADNRDEAIRAREGAVEHGETRIQHREAALKEHEKTLSRRERSIRRAHAAVGARERTIEARERDHETERSKLTDMKRAVDLREDMLQTKELELLAREADRGGRLEALLQKSLDKQSSRQTVRETSDSATTAAVHESNAEVEGSYRQEQSTAPPTRSAPQQATSTVRRQLAFFETSRKTKEINANESPSPVYRPTEQDEVADDDSEVAAEQLLPELISARQYWQERAERLERIVQSMRDKAWALNPHIEPVLTSVAEGLAAIRREIVEVPPPGGEHSPKNAYMGEQACQIRWREQMKRHFDAVREVQAGLLIRLNRDDAIEERKSQHAQMQEHESHSISPAVKSGGSVDATLDITATADMSDDSTVEDGFAADLTGSFQRFRVEMRDQSISKNPFAYEPASVETDLITRLEAIGRTTRTGGGGEREAMDQGRHRERADDSKRSSPNEATETAGKVGNNASGTERKGQSNNILTELASLRDDLEKITGLEKTER